MCTMQHVSLLYPEAGTHVHSHMHMYTITYAHIHKQHDKQGPTHKHALYISK